MELKIIGTSHIAEQSKREVRNAINEFRPDIIALELDPGRLHGLMTKQKSSKIAILRSVGVSGFLFATIGEVIQKLLGKLVKMSPGIEMITAINIAKKEKIRIALIDQPIELTLQNFSKKVPGREKLKMVWDLVLGMFGQEKIKLDLTKVPSQDLVIKLLEMIHAKYPKLYKVLISDRNRVMVSNLIKIGAENQDKRVLAIVGAGHVPGMLELFKATVGS